MLDGQARRVSDGIDSVRDELAAAKQRRDTMTAPPAADSPPAGAVDASGGDVSGLLVILAWSVAGSYVIKYGETLLPFVADGDSLAVVVLAPLMVAAATGFNCWKWQQRSQAENDFGGLI